jgi:hypothetical protein
MWSYTVIVFVLVLVVTVVFAGGGRCGGRRGIADVKVHVGEREREGRVRGKWKTSYGHGGTRVQRVLKRENFRGRGRFINASWLERLLIPRGESE